MLITRETTRCRLGAKAISYIGYWYDRDNRKDAIAFNMLDIKKSELKWRAPKRVL